MKLKIAELQGKGYDLGRSFAALFPNYNRESMTEFSSALKDNSELKRYVLGCCENIGRLYPDYFAELCGRADGFGIDRDTFILSLCCQNTPLSQLTVRESCSDILVKNSRGVIAGHNEDLAEDLNELALIKYINDDGSWFYDMSSCNCLAGYTFGWNSKGLIFSVNAISTDITDKSGIPISLMLKDYTNCGSIDEVVKSISANTCDGAVSVNITDSKTNEACNIERCFAEVDVIKVEESYCHTNHLIHTGISYRNKELTVSTKQRLDICERLIKSRPCDDITADDVRDVLLHNKGEEDYVRRLIGEDKYPTVATFTADTANKQIVIVSHYDKEIYKFSIS